MHVNYTKMKYVSATPNLDSRLFGLLLLPSWFSAAVAVIVGLLVGIGTVVLTHYQSSTFRLELLNTQVSQPTAYQSLTDRILSNNFISNLPLLLFWTLVGLVVYLFTSNILAAIRSTAELKSELEYVHVNRHSLLVTAAEHLLVRLVVLVIWVFFIVFFFNHVLPYCVAAALAGSGSQGSLLNVSYVLLSIVIMTAAVHLHTIFFRLLLLRPRIFSSAVYID